MTKRMDGPEVPIAATDDRSASAAITKNIEGAFDFIESLIVDPDLAERIPDGSTIVLEYEHDTETTLRNRTAAEKLYSRGERVHVHRVHTNRANGKGSVSKDRD